MFRNLILAETIEGLCLKMMKSVENDEYKEAQQYGQAILMCIKHMDVDESNNSEIKALKIGVETQINLINQLQQLEF